MDTAQISWPGWETVKIIGRGSFGTVYEIQRDVLGDVEKAALKVISIPQDDHDIEEMYGDGYDDVSITATFKEHLKSIVAEYTLMKKLNDSVNIVNCDDIRYVQHDNGFGWDIFIKMELLTPLVKALPDSIPEETVVKVAMDLCGALELCEKNKIIHRDIKPQNIFVSPNGNYKLGDFGIAKNVEKTMGGTKIGTYKYMAPEVYNNQPYGTAADIYSLGLVMYWMLNKRRMPFLPLPPEKLKAGIEEEARNRRFAGEKLPAPKHGSAALQAIVLKACAYDPAERYHSAYEMLEDLERLGRSEEVLIENLQEASKDEKPHSDPEPILVWNAGERTESRFEAETLTIDQSIVSAHGDKRKGHKGAKAKRWIAVVAAIAVMAGIAGAIWLNTSNQDGELKAREKDTSTITAEVDGVSDTGAIEVIERTVEQIEIVQEPAVLSYFVGDSIDTSGLTLKILFSDGKTETVTTGFRTEYDFSSVGSKKVEVIYGEHKTDYSVLVSEPALVSVSVSTLPDKTTYIVGEEFNPSGMVLELHYENGETEYSTSGYSCRLKASQASTTTIDSKNNNAVIVSYGGKETTFAISVNDPSVISINAVIAHDRTYYIGDKFDETTLQISAQYNNGSEASVSPNSCEIQYDFSSAGTKNVTIQYEGTTKDISVQVKTPMVTIAIDSTNGITMKLSASTEPVGQYIKWGTNSSAVVGITTDGLVTAKSSGEATIIAEFDYNGETYSDTIILSPKISVEIAPWSTTKDTSVPANSVIEFKQRERVTSTEYFLAHYCINYSPYFTSYTNQTDDSSFNANCSYHEVGWVDSGSVSPSNGNGTSYWVYETGYQQAYKYNGGYRCKSGCYLWYIMDTKENKVTEYQKIITTVKW